MNIRITTTDRIIISSDDYKGEFTLKKRDGTLKKMLITQTGAEKFADWFFGTGGNIMIKPVNFVVAQEFKLDFANKVKELKIQYKASDGETVTEAFRGVKGLFMKKADAEGFILKVDVDTEGQIEELNINITQANGSRDGLQAEKTRLEGEYNTIVNDISELRASISALEGLIAGKKSEYEKIKDEIAKLEAENKEKDEELAKLRQEQDKLKIAEEALDLDVDAARKTINALKDRLADNQDSVELMDDLFKQKKPISVRIKNIGKDIEGVEKGIGLIARFQEKLADTINTAVADTEGNGTVDSLVEAGGELARGKLRSDEQSDQTAEEST